MRGLIKRGNFVYIASPTERRFRKKTHLIQTENCQILKIKTLNIQKTNIIEKGIGTLLLEHQFDKAINRYWGNVKFDLVLYATPPITFNKVIESVKKRCNCRSYLMLKDIFPQNAVDLNMMKEGSIIHNMFRKKEERLYQISDRIGCMSPANCAYIINHNPKVGANKVELCPNAIELVKIQKLSENERIQLLQKLGIPEDKTLYVYGGNLGKPQGLDFLLDVVAANEKRTGSFIIIAGNGTEYDRISKWFESKQPKNAKLIPRLPKFEYDRLVSVCDVGLIFLDPNFTIPNFPSRLLCYLENSMPVLLATDSNTDMGSIAENNGFGLWSPSGDLDAFMSNMDKLTPEAIKEMGTKAYRFLQDNYTVEKVVKIIENYINNNMQE